MDSSILLCQHLFNFFCAIQQSHKLILLLVQFQNIYHMYTSDRFHPYVESKCSPGWQDKHLRIGQECFPFQYPQEGILPVENSNSICSHNSTGSSHHRHPSRPRLVPLGPEAVQPLQTSLLWSENPFVFSYYYLLVQGFWVNCLFTG